MDRSQIARGGILVVLLAGASLLSAQPGAEATFAIQRVVVVPDRVAKELDKVRQGTLVALPRQQFEDRVTRAFAAAKARAPKPRLTRAYYAAELTDRAFAGSGQWTVQHAGTAFAILPIEPLNLAIAKMKWEQGQDAILADLDGKSLGLIVQQKGNASCLFDWSARGTPTTDGIAFTLFVPPTPMTTFDLKLPSDYWLTSKTDILLTGPHVTESPRTRLWKLQASGAKPIDLLARKVAGSDTGPATMFARVHSVQKTKPERIEVDHDFQIDLPQGSVQQVILEGDANLRPFSVALGGSALNNWKWEQTPAKKDAKGKLAPATGILTIPLPQPLQGKLPTLRVRSLVANAQSGSWSSPGLTVRGAVTRGETLEIHLHPDVPLGKWDPGSFYATQLATELDGTQVITLAETAEAPRRPSMTAPLKRVELHVTEDYVWDIGPYGMTLGADLQFSPSASVLFELRAKLPTGVPTYQIESLDLQPADLLGSWHPDGANLVVALKKPLVPGKKATLKVRMRSKVRDFTAAIRNVAFPNLAPDLPVSAANRREGTITVLVDPVFRARLAPPMPTLAASDRVNDVKDAARFRLTFRDQRPNVVVRVEPQPVQVQVRGKHSIVLNDQEALLNFGWDVQPRIGSAEFLDFRLGAGFPSSWTLKADEGRLPIHRWERLPLQEALPHLLQLGSTPGIPSSALERMLPRGTYWRFYLEEPLRKKAHFTLEARGRVGMVEDEWRRIALTMPTSQPWEFMGGAVAAQMLPKSQDGTLWSVPLMTPVQRAALEQEILLDSPGAPISRLLADDGFVRYAEKMPTQVRIAQDADESPNQLRVWTRPEKRAISQLERCDEAQRIAYVHKDGRTYYCVQFRLWHWRDRTFALKLPAGFQIIAVKVHDRWLTDLNVVASPTETRLTLPFDQNTENVRYEVLGQWQRSETSWPGRRNVRVPRVEWPTAPNEVRTRYFLDEGVAPLFQEALIPVGVPARLAQQTATPRWLRQAWTWGQAWLPYGERQEIADQLQGQKQAVLLAEAHVRAELAKPMKLGDALERFALEHLKTGVPLVIDQVACRSLGVSAESTVSASDRPFWESLGLIYVPCRSGALLTTARRMQSLGITTSAELDDLDEAVREAVIHGRDASAGFYLIVTWLRLPTTQADGSYATLADAGEALEMTEWEMRPEAPTSDELIVVDPWAARWIGWLLAALAAFTGWRLQRSADPLMCFRVHVLALAATVLIVLWSPINVREFFLLPTLFVEIVWLIACIGRMIGGGTVRATVPSTITQPKTAAATLAVLLLALAWNASAQQPAPRTYTVLLIDDGAKPTVLAPPELLARLDEMEEQALPGAVLVSGKYSGKAKAGLVKFDAQFEAQSFKDKSTLIIPLAGVQLSEGVFLDGAPVLPTPHKNGYALPVVGKGPHHIRLSFSVRVVESDHHEINFSVPKLAQNEIAVQWQPAVHGVHCERACGAEKTLIDAGRNVTEWQAQIGYEKKIHVRWSDATAKAIDKAIEVKEVHYWDLRPGSAGLLTSLQYAIGKGSLTRLDVAMPAGLHVRRVEALPAAGAPASAAPVIKQWRLAPEAGEQRLIVEFVNPVAGQVTLNLDVVPRSIGPTGNLILALPAPLQGESVAGWLGYRVDAIETSRKAQNLVAVLPASADEFDQQWKKQSAPARPDSAPVARAVRFQRKSSKAWLELITQPHLRQAQGHLDWSLDAQHADLRGKFTIISPNAEFVYLEFYVDKTLTLAEVSGTDVARWHLQDGLLQVWLRQARKETTLQLSGWRAVPFKGAPPAKRAFVLPAVYPLQTQMSGVTLEIRPAPDIRATAERFVRLRPTTPDKLQFAIEGPAYEASFQLSPTPRPVEASRLTKVTAADRGMEIWESVRLTTQRGQLPTLTLHVKNWPHALPVIDAPGAVVSRVVGAKSKGLKHPAWTLKYPSGLPQDVLLALTFRVAKDTQSVKLPEIELEGAVGRHWLIWQDVEVQTDSGKKLAAAKPAKNGVPAYQADGWLTGSPTWNHAAFERNLKVTLPSTSVRTSVRVLSSTQTAHMTSGARWLHKASFWIHAPEATELRFRFPGPVAELGAWLDGSARAGHLAPNRADAEFVLPISGSSQPRLVELRWHGTDAERMDAPNIVAVQIEQAPLPAYQFVVWVPSGMTPATSDRLPAFAARLLHEARTHMQITAMLAQDPASSADARQRILALQQQFQRELRHAQYALTLLDNERFQIPPAPWRERWTALKNQNAWLAKENRFETERLAAEKNRSNGREHATGEPDEPFGLGVVLPANVPGISLSSVHAQVISTRWTNTHMYLLTAVLAFAASYIRAAWSILRFAAPEIAIGLTATAGFVFGVGVIAVVLVGLMLVIRLLWTVKRFGARADASASTMVKPPSNLQPPPTPAG